MTDVPALPHLAVFGEALTDFVRTGEGTWHSVAGGACWNVARVAATLGVPAAWAGAVGTGVLGDEIIGKSRAAGLDLRFAQVVAEPPLVAYCTLTAPARPFVRCTRTLIAPAFSDAATVGAANPSRPLFVSKLRVWSRSTNKPFLMSLTSKLPDGRNG